jgi:hypothetical protein
MINELRSSARVFDTVREQTTPSPARRHVTHGVAGAVLGATWFGAAFPLVLTALAAPVGAADAVVFAASGALFGLISGGSIGAVVGGRGR